MSTFKGLHYWLKLANHNELFHNTITEYIDRASRDPINYNQLLDLSLALEVLGNNEYLNIQNTALQNKQIYTLHIPEELNDLKFLKKVYDAKTKLPVSPDPFVLVLKVPGTVMSNMNLELYCKSVNLDIAYINSYLKLDAATPRWQSIYVAVAPLEHNATLLNTLNDILDTVQLPVLNHPSKLLKLLPASISSILENISSLSFLNVNSEIEKLKSYDNFYYEYNVFCINGLYFVHSMNIAESFTNLASQQEMLTSPKLFLAEEMKMRLFEEVYDRHAVALNELYNQLQLDIFMLTCIETDTFDLTITGIHTNYVWDMQNNTSALHRKYYGDLIQDAISDLLSYPRTSAFYKK